MSLEDEIRKIVRDLVQEELKELGVMERPTPEKYRLDAGLTMVELEIRSGISHPTIGRVERGEIRRLRPETLQKIAMALNVAPADYANAAMRVREVLSKSNRETDSLLSKPKARIVNNALPRRR